MGIEAPFLFSSCLEDICWKLLEDQTGGIPGPCDILFTDMSFWWWHIISPDPSGPRLKNAVLGKYSFCLAFCRLRNIQSLLWWQRDVVWCLSVVCWAAACLFSSLLKGMFKSIGYCSKAHFPSQHPFSTLSFVFFSLCILVLQVLALVK